MRSSCVSQYRIARVQPISGEPHMEGYALTSVACK
jgi:hypothetical protein